MTKARIVAACALIAITTSVAAEKENRAPKTLTIGYEEEGKIDASTTACQAFVTEMVDWDKAEMDQAVIDVCTARKRHVDAYARLQESYSAFAKALNEDTRLDVAAAVTSFGALVRSCIDFKTNLTTGGHNIAIDIIPNDIAADCLDMGTGLLDAETRKYTEP